MRENRFATLVIALVLVISIAIVPAAEASAQAWISLSRPDPLIVPSDVFHNSPRIEWRKELRLPNKPFGSSEFHFLPYTGPDSYDEAPVVGGNWC